MNLDDEELIATKILNGSMSRNEIVKYIGELQKELKKLIPTPTNPVPVEYQTDIYVNKRDYISKQKIKDKIEELKEIKYEEIQYDEINDFVNGMMLRASKRYDYEIAQFTIKILQEILEESE